MRISTSIRVSVSKSISLLLHVGARVHQQVCEDRHRAVVNGDARVLRGAGGDVGERPGGLEERRVGVEDRKSNVAFSSRSRTGGEK